MVNTPQFIRSIVLTTRIRLARNLVGFPFPTKMSEAHAGEILYLVEDALSKIDPDEYTRYYVRDLKNMQATLLQEQYLISTALRRHARIGAAYVSLDKTVSIMVNEEDHLREQYICKGFELKKAYERLSAIDDGLSNVLNFAFDEKLGYLTSCPSNIGTGMRASVMMYLPGLTWKREIANVLREWKEQGMTIRGSLGEGSEVEGCLYQVSNERTLGWSEKEILEKVSEFAMNLCDRELRAREQMLNRMETELRDRCLRAYGALCNCALLDLDEFLRKSADVRLGLALGFLDAEDYEAFEEFMDDMRPATFCMDNNLEGENERFYDEVRAETVGSVLPKIVEVVRRGDKMRRRGFGSATFETDGQEE